MNEKTNVVICLLMNLFFKNQSTFFYQISLNGDHPLFCSVGNFNFFCNMSSNEFNLSKEKNAFSVSSTLKEIFEHDNNNSQCTFFDTLTFK